MGPIIGGFLTQVFDWRAVFWFLAIFTGLCFVSFIFFKDTFRRERSLTYQTVLKQVLEHEAAKRSETSTVVAGDIHEEKNADAPTLNKEVSQIDNKVADKDVEAQTPASEQAEVAPILNDFRLTLKDVNPIGPIIHVLRRMNNLVILIASGTANNESDHPQSNVANYRIDFRVQLFNLVYLFSHAGKQIRVQRPSDRSCIAIIRSWYGIIGILECPSAYLAYSL